MGEFERLLEKQFKTFRKNEVVNGTILKITENAVYVDVGFKVEAIIPREELPENIKEGDYIKAVVVRLGKNGQPVLSHKKYVEGKLYYVLKSHYEKGTFVSGRVKQVKEDHYVIDLNGLDAYMPKNEGRKGLKVGSRVTVKITEFRKDKDGINIKVSEKPYMKERDEKKKKKLLEKLKVGDIVDGKVIKIDPQKGITLLVGGVLRAFLPKEELSWGRDKNPYNYAEIDERLKVKIKKIAKNGEFIFVSLRETKENPWEKASQIIKKGDIIQGNVIETTDKGLILEIEEGLEGFVPKNEIAYGDLSYKRGTQVKAKVLEFDPNKRRLLLSIKKALPKPWEEYIKSNPVGSKIKGKVEKIEGARAVIDLGSSVKGIVHKNDLSWSKIGRMEDVLNVGEEREFVVLGVEGDLVKLGIKQLTVNPWELISQKYKVGDKVSLQVKSRHPFGVFLGFPEGVDGLLPLSEIPKGAQIEIGQTVDVRIIDMDIKNEKITLSMKEENRKIEMEENLSEQSADVGFTLGDILKKKMKL